MKCNLSHEKTTVRCDCERCRTRALETALEVEEFRRYLNLLEVSRYNVSEVAATSWNERF